MDKTPLAADSRDESKRDPSTGDPVAAGPHEGDDQFRLLVESVVDYAIFLLDVNGHVRTWNAGAERLKGYRAEEIIGSHFSRFYTPDALARDWPASELTIARREGRFEDEGWRVRKDGSAFWANVVITALYDHSGILQGFAKITRDLTQRKLAEDAMRASLLEKELLLKEIHHRVKNNLQIVSTLLDLQAEHITDPDALAMFKESRGRVRSMALIHERLYRSADLAHVDVAEYARQLAGDLYRSYRVSTDEIDLDVTVSTPPLPIDIAIPCGLLLNELIANSLKHAFEGGGRISIALKDEGASNVLTVSDTGKGFPDDFDIRITSSFGLQLVNTLVAQLNGEISTNHGPGAEITVRFPNTK